MEIKLFDNHADATVQNILNNPKRSGKLLAGSAIFTVVVMTCLEFNPLTSLSATVLTIGVLFFSLQFVTTPKKTFSFTTFPTWYKEKNIFDCALLSDIWLEYQGKKVTAALAVSENTKPQDIKDRQQGTFEVLHATKAQIPIVNIFDQQKERGLAVRSENNLYTLGVDETFVKNRQKALAYVEQQLICHHRQIKTPEQMEFFILNLHKLLANDLVNSSGIPIPPGEYRNSIILLPKDNVGHDPNKVVSNVRKKNPKLVKRFCTLYKKVKEAKNPSETIRQFSKVEAQIFGLGYDTLYTDPKEIPEAMKKFCRDYLQKIKAKTNALDLATWLHMELIKIHPFVDLNGHTSRILASAELRRGDLSPLFIFDENAYVKAQENRDPKEFKAFLQRTISLSKKLGLILDTEKPKKRVGISIQARDTA